MAFKNHSSQFGQCVATSAGLFCPRAHANELSIWNAGLELLWRNRHGHYRCRRGRWSCLAQVGDGSLVKNVEELRPHSHQIRTIAKRYLSQWFNKPSDPDARELTVILTTLGDADDYFFNELVVFAKQIQDVSRCRYRSSCAIDAGQETGSPCTAGECCSCTICGTQAGKRAGTPIDGCAN